MNTHFSTNTAVSRKISPPSARGKKRDGLNRLSHSNGNGGDDTKRQKLEPMDLDPLFPKLNQSDPVHARRIQQRRKNVAMGKNTPGYFAYTKQVPKHLRKPRSMNTPNTPDHTLDIPAKRWQGMVKAWRKALHQYDPPDFATNANNISGASESSKCKVGDKDKFDGNVQARQIEDAIAKGLLVDVSTPVRTQLDSMDDLGSPISILGDDSSARGQIMDMEDAEFSNFDEDFAGEESDDDLL